MRTEYSDDCGSPCKWAVINTHPHREQVAVENLQRQEFHAYCPMVRRRLHAAKVAAAETQTTALRAGHCARAAACRFAICVEIALNAPTGALAAI